VGFAARTAKPKLSICFYRNFVPKLVTMGRIAATLCSELVSDTAARSMALLLFSFYLLLGVFVSNAQTHFVSYVFALTAWPLLIIGLGLRSRIAARPAQLRPAA
jgi:hypothetical protein